MDTDALLEELLEQRRRIEEAIAALERLARTVRPRRGRPPAWTKGLSGLRGRPVGSKNTPKAAGGKK